MTSFLENGAFNNRYFSNRYFLALIYGIYFRIYRIYLIIYLFGSKLLLIFTNTTTYRADVSTTCSASKPSLWFAGTLRSFTFSTQRFWAHKFCSQTLT